VLYDSGGSERNMDEKERKKIRAVQEIFRDRPAARPHPRFKNGVKTGLGSLYAENGKVTELWQIKNGVSDGTYERFYASGAIEQKGSFAKGDRDGNWFFYRENGFMFEPCFLTRM